jgi:phenylacetate-coenzyme A ligase PaaK-like adenylate-forming protein
VIAASSAAQRLQGELLRETIAWCRSSSAFYRERFSDAGDISELADLGRLPVLFRQDVVDSYDALRCDPSLPAAIQHTTGTTGSFLQVYRGASEQAFVWQFMAAQLAATPEPPIRPLHLVLANAYHGTLTPVPSRAYLISVGVHDGAQASQARQVLEKTYALPGVAERVGVVSGTERMVKALTAYLVAGQFDFASSPVKRIDLFGGHVTPRGKSILAATWGAEIFDHYSLTEMFGGAREIGIGGPWIFEPHVIAEAVHPRTFQQVGPGEVGVLLMTSLYPFTQQMPLIRYVTGDLVEVVESADHPAGLQVRYLGRSQRSIVDDSGDKVRPLLLSGPLYEVIETLPDVAVSPRFSELDAGVGLEMTGDHHYAVRHEATETGRPERITVELGLRYAPWLFTDRVNEIRSYIARYLFATHPELSRRVAVGDLDLRIEARPAAAVAPYDSK